MLWRICASSAVVFGLSAATAVAQDQTLVVDQPLELCVTPAPITTADLSVADAAAVIAAALRIKQPDPGTYYIVHATEFVKNRTTVAEEHWFVYFVGWHQTPWYWWFTDSRQLERFKESRIMGSSRVGLVYLYLNVPTFTTLDARDQIAEHFTKAHAEDLTVPTDPAEGKERSDRLNRFVERLLGSLPGEAEHRAASAAAARQSSRTAAPDPLVERIIQLETERYLKAFGDGDRTIINEVALVNQDTGEDLVGLSPTVATTDTFSFLNTLFYKVAVTKKQPAPLENLKSAAKLAFAGQSDAQTRVYVEPVDAAVCAGGVMDVKHVPSDVLVSALTTSGTTEVLRSKQAFDNEGKYWWDVSFALPLSLRRDVTVNVDAGQVAAKKVEKADLFAVVNLGLPRDTKGIQWQLAPTLIYGIPITGKPLKHHLVGFTIGLNYVQLMGGLRFDRRQEVTTSVENDTPVGIEQTPPGEKWEQKWVMGINIPVATVVGLFKKK
jgi:hypothetical protein